MAVARRVREVAAQLGERVRAEMRALPMPTCGHARVVPCGRLLQSFRGWATLVGLVGPR